MKNVKHHSPYISNKSNKQPLKWLFGGDAPTSANVSPSSNRDMSYHLTSWFYEKRGARSDSGDKSPPSIRALLTRIGPRDALYLTNKGLRIATYVKMGWLPVNNPYGMSLTVQKEVNNFLKHLCNFFIKLVKRRILQILCPLLLSP